MRILVAASSILVVLTSSAAAVQEPAAPGSWKLPPPEVVRLVDLPPPPGVSVDPTKQWLLLSHGTTLPPLSDLARPMLRLAGVRVDPASNGRHGPRRTIGLSLLPIAGGAEKRLALPADASVGFVDFAPKGERFAFTLTFADGIEVWIGDTASTTARAVTPRRVNGLVGAFRWMPDGKRLLVQMVPEARGPAPERPAVPSGPTIQESSADAGPVRTYQDLLTDRHDERLFEHYFTSEPWLFDAAAAAGTQVVARKIGPPAIYVDLEPSPDGELLLVTRLAPPWSYLFPLSSFPAVTEVWDRSGRVVREIERHPLLDNVPIEGVPTGPRSIQWRADLPATLVWAEALDGGDPKTKVPHRDRVMQLELGGAAAQASGTASAATAVEPRELARTEHRYRGMSWFDQPGLALVREYDRDRRWMRTWLHDFAPAALAAPSPPAPRLVWDRSAQDRYGDPGSPLTIENEFGRNVILASGGSVLLAGAGATKEGNRPFLDRMSLADFTTERLWQCEGEQLESVVTWLEPDGDTVLTRHESPSEPPNWCVRTLAADGKSSRRAVTSFADPAPELRTITKKLVTYPRQDGVNLSATLYLPPDYREGTRLPLVVWAYPQEYVDPSTAGQVSGSPYAFTTIRGISHLFLLTQGYAVLDGAAMPVVGPPETANDTFVEQIVASAQAAIDHAVELGVADRERVGVGGHSYGAFMTANLLAHCDLFKAGIARSGAYNRSLTPFGFQNERRTFWEAPDVYVNLSPFTHAQKIDEPLLLIHGELDNNSGTFPIQSERLYQAVKGHGGTARFVLLPYESHGYIARESVLHTLAEMIEWFGTYCRGDLSATNSAHPAQ